MRRREFIAAGVGGVAAASLGAAFWDDLFENAEQEPRRRGPGYGRLGTPDGNGLRLPPGFRAREVARGGQEVAGTGYRWHLASDGAATFPVEAGGFVLVSNAETFRGGASAIRFGRDGQPAAAYRILEGTTTNCSGGGTPWGTWLSCEEVESGQVWECDPSGRKRAVARPAMGVFKHEAAAVDPKGKSVYLTEDHAEGRLYRFTPARWPDLSAGLLEVAKVSSRGMVKWAQVPDPAASKRPLREQVPDSTVFKRGEGIWREDRILYVATTADHRVHAYDIDRQRTEVVYDGLASRSAPLLRVDQLTGSRGGEVFVCEDVTADEIDVGLIDGRGRVAKFLSATGLVHRGSELTGATFDPSGSRMFVASQRAHGGDGAIYEVSGPFRGSTSGRVPRSG